MGEFWWNLIYAIEKPLGTIFLIIMGFFIFTYLYGELLPANTGTTMGIGIGAILGIFSGYYGGTLGLFAGVVLVGTLGGFIGNGIYWLFTGHI